MRRAILTLRREDGRIVCESVLVADKTGPRMRGLLGRGQLGSQDGIVLRPAWSIHTWFMRFPIDAVFLDPDQVVIKIVPELKPFGTASCRGAREVVELRAGEAGRRGLQIGDRVAWAARSAWDEGPGSESVLSSAHHATGGDVRHGSVLVASSDERFSKLLKFLLDGQALDVAAIVPLADIAEGVREHPADVVVVDVDRRLADGLRKANAARASRPEVELVVVAADRPQHPPGGVTVFDKWNDTDAIVTACARAVDGTADAERDSGNAGSLRLHAAEARGHAPVERETWS